jgi:plastocyanin
MRPSSIACVVLLCACSSPTPGSDGGTDSGSGMDAAVVNGCTTFTDDTASGGTVTGPSNATPAQYMPNCVHVKVGQMVTWNSAFGAHPLQPAGGTTPTPIQLTSSGTTVSFTFSAAGTYGFECMVHPGIMNGAVEVTP